MSARSRLPFSAACFVLFALVLSGGWCHAASRPPPASSVAAPLRDSAAWREAVAQLRRYRQGDGQAPRPLSIRAFSSASPSAAARSLAPTGPAPDWERITRLAARRHGVEAALIKAVLQIESNFNPRAVSSKGALGAMQIMPDTGRELGLTNFFDPEANTDAGTRYLAAMLRAFPKLDLALAAYNAGPEAVRHYGAIPPYAETRAYVSRVLDAYRKLSAPNLR